MKQLLLLILTVSVFFNSCNPKQESESKNLILYNNVEALYFTDTTFFQNKMHYDFLQTVTEAGISGKIKVYDFPLATFDFSKTPELLNSEFLKSNLKISEDTLVKADPKTGKTTTSIFAQDYRRDTRNLYFVEEWNFGKDNKFIKTIKYYAPVRYYYSALSPDKQMTSISFVVKNQDITQKDKMSLISIATNISYILNIETDYTKGPIINGLNKNKLISMLIDSVTTGKVKGYDLDLSKFEISSKILSPDQIRKNLGETIETVTLKDINGNPIGTKTDTLKAIDRKNEIKALIFIENWFYDPETFSFIKDVVGFGPVREYENPEVSGMMMKTIPFIISMQ